MFLSVRCKPFDKRFRYIENAIIVGKTGKTETFVPTARPKKNHALFFSENLFFFSKYMKKAKKNI